MIGIGAIVPEPIHGHGARGTGAGVDVRQVDVEGVLCLVSKNRKFHLHCRAVLGRRREVVRIAVGWRNVETAGPARDSGGLRVRAETLSGPRPAAGWGRIERGDFGWIRSEGRRVGKEWR